MKNTNEICSLFIPPEIISHLWNIVDMYGDDNYIFVLSSRRLGDAKIQDIEINIDRFSFHHTVLGFDPVNFTVKICKRGGDLVMSLALSEKALSEINKWNRIRAALTFRRKKVEEAPHRLILRRAS
ncbi:MAG: hypothetical protein QMB62_08530 [Oscillospiraceae bacterium]